MRRCGRRSRRELLELPEPLELLELLELPEPLELLELLELPELPELLELLELPELLELLELHIVTGLARLKKAELIERVAKLEAELERQRANLDRVLPRLKAALPHTDEMSDWQATRAAMALNLAEQLDSYVTGYWEHPPAPAPVAKELRAILDSLEAALSGDDDDLADLFAAPVRNVKN